MGQPKAPVFQGMKRSPSHRLILRVRLTRKERILAVLTAGSTLVIFYFAYRAVSFLHLPGFPFLFTMPLWLTGVMLFLGRFFERVFKL